MTITIAVMCVLLGIVVGAFGALMLNAASWHWRVLGMREITAYRSGAPSTSVTVGNRPDSRIGSRADGVINGHEPPTPPPSIPPPGTPPGA